VSFVLRWTDLSQIPQGFGPSVVTLGNFDGVHKGHRAVLSSVVEEAGKRGAHSVAVTFDPHPLALLHPERALQMITSTDLRLELLSASGLDAVLVMEFTRELASWTPERFVVDVFVKALGASLVVVGEDTRFGVRNSGDVETLRRLGEELGFEVLTLADVGNGGRWSSSRVRELVTTGDVAGVAESLGRPHAMAGEVVHGDHRGRQLGYPTANLSSSAKGLIPADGVYAGFLIRPTRPERDPDHKLPAAISAKRAMAIGTAGFTAMLAVVALERFLGPIRERRAQYAAKPGLVDEIVHAGSERGRSEAKATLHEMRAAMKLDYFGL